MEMWTEGNKLRISVKALPEFRKLLEQAEKEAQQLHETMRQLASFTVDIEIETDELRQK